MIMQGYRWMMLQGACPRVISHTCLSPSSFDRYVDKESPFHHEAGYDVRLCFAGPRIPGYI